MFRQIEISSCAVVGSYYTSVTIYGWPTEIRGSPSVVASMPTIEFEDDVERADDKTKPFIFPRETISFLR